jgi:hypothetical protein
MIGGWRRWSIGAGTLLTLCGIVLWMAGGGFVLLIVGAIAMVTALAEPIYGRAEARPFGGTWRPTDEKFVDPESGELVSVWFDPATGERRYVDDGRAEPGGTA